MRNFAPHSALLRSAAPRLLSRVPLPRCRTVPLLQDSGRPLHIKSRFRPAFRQQRSFAQQAQNEADSSAASSTASAKSDDGANDSSKPEEKTTAEENEGTSSGSSSAGTAETESGEAAEGADTDAVPEKSEADLLAQEIEELGEKVRAKKHEVLLSLADFENNKKKFTKERENRRRNAVTNFATKMVHVYGEFEAELLKPGAAAAKEGLSESCKALYEGVVMTGDVYRSGLERFDVSQISPGPGDTFSDKQHEDAGSILNSDLPPGTVAEVLVPGWSLGGTSPTVLQRAKVKLASASE